MSHKLIKFDENYHYRHDKEGRKLTDEGNCTLICPKCGNMNLHHGAVLVYERAGEDGPVTRYTLNQATLTVDQNAEGNPSSRRDGIRIGFTCEECGWVPTLAIEQHKGSTYISWMED